MTRSLWANTSHNGNGGRLRNVLRHCTPHAVVGLTLLAGSALLVGSAG